ncbi:MAG: hypothetical protein HY592_03195 [Candidatus Omnitrophica bacterium]|nr:hypothetical protein [Candidatus Omnitrophota bacterium]
MRRHSESMVLFVFLLVVSLVVAGGCREQTPALRIDQRSHEPLRAVEPPEEVIAPINEDLKVVAGEPMTAAEEPAVPEEGQTADKKTGAVAIKTEY